MQPTLVSGDYLLTISFVNNLLKKNSLVVLFDNTHWVLGLRRLSLYRPGSKTPEKMQDSTSPVINLQWKTVGKLVLLGF